MAIILNSERKFYMNNLFNFTQTKGKRHKFPSFNLGGAKLYKNFAQKLLAVSLCIAVILLGTSVTTLAAGEVDDLVVSYDSKLNMNNLLENTYRILAMPIQVSFLKIIFTHKKLFL